jgi:hypothetical protein
MLCAILLPKELTMVTTQQRSNAATQQRSNAASFIVWGYGWFFP